jgi:hypothetical protein
LESIPAAKNMAKCEVETRLIRLLEEVPLERWKSRIAGDEEIRVLLYKIYVRLWEVQTMSRLRV